MIRFLFGMTCFLLAVIVIGVSMMVWLFDGCGE